MIEVCRPAAALAARIESRTRWMFAEGLVEECRALLDAGLGDAMRALRSVGYDEALDLIDGHLSRAEAEARTTLRTRQLAKRQRTWFRHQLEAVSIDAEGKSEDALLEATLAAIHEAESEAAG